MDDHQETKGIVVMEIVLPLRREYFPLGIFILVVAARGVSIFIPAKRQFPFWVGYFSLGDTVKGSSAAQLLATCPYCHLHRGGVDVPGTNVLFFRIGLLDSSGY
jgi:hypothetical protein